MPLVEVDQLIINNCRTHEGVACPRNGIDESGLDRKSCSSFNLIESIIVRLGANRSADTYRDSWPANAID